VVREWGKQGIEPPAQHPIRSVWAAWDVAKEAPNIDNAIEHVQAMLDLHRENTWTIGIVGEQPAPLIVADNLHNVPEDFLYHFCFGYLSVAEPAQFAFTGD
jgi:peptide/nickel transport system substrate-binding protein